MVLTFFAASMSGVVESTCLGCTSEVKYTSLPSKVDMSCAS